jgi:2-aminoadipate transaminase
MADFIFREQLSAMARERLGVTEIGEMIALVAENGAISFGAGEPSGDLFPKEEIKQAVAEAFNAPEAWGYYHDEFGFIGLREWIAERMASDGISPPWVRPDNILLTNGGGEAMSIVSEALIDAGSLVLVESPSYTESLLTFRKQGAVCVAVPSDDDGVIPEELAKIVSSRRVRFLYTIPNFQNPSGRTAPLERRAEILRILREYDVAIVEDDPYHYLSYDGDAPQSYLALAGGDKRVIHCNSFSKTIAPGLRVGWAVAPPALTDIFLSLRVSAGLGRPVAIQMGVHNYLRSIDFGARVEWLRGVYRKRRGVMLGMIAKYLAPLGIKTNSPGGGFFIWAESPEEKDMARFALHAVRNEKVGIIPGRAFYPAGDTAGDRAFRLSYAKAPESLVEEGMRRLARAWKTFA